MLWVPKALQMTNEAGRDAGNKSTLCHDACFDVVELQPSVVTHHLAWRRGGCRGWVEKKDKKRKEKRTLSDTNTKGLI